VVKILKKYAKFTKPSKELFWVWVAYQSVKGILTTTFIWIPALVYWLNSGSH